MRRPVMLEVSTSSATWGERATRSAPRVPRAGVTANPGAVIVKDLNTARPVAEPDLGELRCRPGPSVPDLNSSILQVPGADGAGIRLDDGKGSQKKYAGSHSQGLAHCDRIAVGHDRRVVRISISARVRRSESMVVLCGARPRPPSF